MSQTKSTQAFPLGALQTAEVSFVCCWKQYCIQALVSFSLLFLMTVWRTQHWRSIHRSDWSRQYCTCWVFRRDWAQRWACPDSDYSCISCEKAGQLSTGSLFIINFNAKYYYYPSFAKTPKDYVIQSSLINVDIIQLKLMSQYGRAEYWEERYSRDPAAFDWYQRYFSLRDLIGANIPVEFRILNVGSGNSRLSEEMFDDGYENITNIDISQTSIKAMNELYKEKGPNFKYIQMDVRAMEFAENSFDAVIDKGTFDSVVCGEGSNTNASKMLTEVYRVLGPNGVYIMISFGNPDNRLEYLKRKEFEWGIWVHKLMKPTVTAQITPTNTEKDDKNYHFMYICIKGKKNEEGQVVVEEKKEEKK